MKYKVYSLTNLAGLIIGLVCFIFVYLYVMDEISYDAYHTNSERIYRVVVTSDFNGVQEASSSCPFPMAKTLVKEYPDYVEDATRFFNFQEPRVLVESDEKISIEEGFYYADSNVFKIFDFNLIHGHPDSVLNKPFTVVLNEQSAAKYFGNTNPVGKKLVVNERLIFTVSGVMKDLPEQTHFNFDMLGSFSTVQILYPQIVEDNWIWNPCWTYIILKDPTFRDDLIADFPDFLVKYREEADQSEKEMNLQQLDEVHLSSEYLYEMQPNVNITYVWNLLGIAIFILVIAAINYVNLSTSFSISRAKEVAIKKVLGASKPQLVHQFLLEAVLLSLAATIVSIGVVEMIMPFFNDFTGKNLSVLKVLDPAKIGFLFLLGCGVGLLSGLYPAVRLSLDDLLDVFRGKVKSSKKNISGRKIMVIIQLGLSVTFIICTVFVFRQISFIQNADLGFTKDNVITIPAYSSRTRLQYDEFKEDVMKIDGAYSVTGMDYIIGCDHNYHEFRHEGVGDEEFHFYPTLIVRDEFLRTFDLDIIEGRAFDDNDPTDAYNSVLINESMTRLLGWTPAEAIGKRFNSNAGKEKVIGVLKDFQSRSLHTPKQPFVLNMRSKYASHYTKFIAIRYDKTTDYNTFVDELQKVWQKYEPNRPFDHMMLDNQLKDLYKDESNLSQLIFLLTFVSLILALIGLFGLVSFLAEKRMKEFAIRTIVGARTRDILRLLFDDLFYLNIISILLAWLAAWLIIHNWLKQFAEKIEINLIVFVCAALLTIILSIGIALYRAAKVARCNAADILKHE